MKQDAPIIAGIDFSESSASVLHHTLHTSKDRATPVIALHVLDASHLLHRTTSVIGVHNPESIEDDAKAKLKAWIASQTNSDRIQAEVRKGRPAEELHNAVTDHKASLLVIAANDTTKNRLGSIASRCVRTAPSDVMILRNWQKDNFKKIVLCTDFSAIASHALSRAVSIAAEQNAQLEIVHVMYPPTRDIWGEVLEHEADSPKSFVEECHSKVNESMSEFTHPHQDALAEIDHHVTILESVVPSVALTHHIADTGADLVVMGTRGHSLLMSHFIGTNAERLMHDSPVSVLAVRSPK